MTNCLETFLQLVPNRSTSSRTRIARVMLVLGLVAIVALILVVANPFRSPEEVVTVEHPTPIPGFGNTNQTPNESVDPKRRQIERSEPTVR